MWNPVEKIRSGWHSVNAELKKCTWPSMAELRASTVVVIVTISILTAWVYLADLASRGVINLLTVPAGR